MNIKNYMFDKSINIINILKYLTKKSNKSNYKINELQYEISS